MNQLKNIPHYELDGKIYFTKARFRDMAHGLDLIPVVPEEPRQDVKPEPEKPKPMELSKRSKPMPGGYVKPMNWTTEEKRNLKQWKIDTGRPWRQ